MDFRPGQFLCECISQWLTAWDGQDHWSADFARCLHSSFNLAIKLTYKQASKTSEFQALWCAQQTLNPAQHSLRGYDQTWSHPELHNTGSAHPANSPSIAPPVEQRDTQSWSYSLLSNISHLCPQSLRSLWISLYFIPRLPVPGPLKTQEPHISRCPGCLGFSTFLCSFWPFTLGFKFFLCL